MTLAMRMRMMQAVPSNMPCYTGFCRDGHRGDAHAQRLAHGSASADSWSVDVVEELIAEARAAKEHKAAYDEHIGRVRALLITVRKERPALTVVEIEDMIRKVYDRGTISRLTAEAVGTARPKPAPKNRRRS
jgi:hypothetical protein